MLRATPSLDRQAVLRKLRDCVHDPETAANAIPIDLRTRGDAQPALCSL